MHLVLDIPLPASEATERSLPPGISRLVMRPCEARAAQTVVLDAMVKWLCAVGRGERLYAVPLVLFVPVQVMQRLGRECNVWLHRLEDEWCIGCSSAGQIRAVLGEVRCEELAMFFAESDAAAIRTVEGALAFAAEANCRSHNAPFCRSAPAQTFLFYAESHASIEALGPECFIVNRCLPPLFPGKRLEAPCGVAPPR